MEMIKPLVFRSKLTNTIFRKNLKSPDILFQMITISELTECTSDYLNAVNRLLPQLSASAKAISMDRLLELTESDSTMLFLGADQEGDTLEDAVKLVVDKVEMSELFFSVRRWQLGHAT